MSDTNQEQRSKSIFVRHVIALYPWKRIYNLIHLLSVLLRNTVNVVAVNRTSQLHSCVHGNTVLILNGAALWTANLTSESASFYFSCIEINARFNCEVLQNK
jgi:capsule polysaccharide modification protein KpsS